MGRLADRTLEPQETHPEGPFQPAAGVSDTVGATLLSLLAAGPVTASLSIDLSDVTSYNVIAQTKGGDQNNVLHVGGHSDSVIDGELPYAPASVEFSDNSLQVLVSTTMAPGRLLSSR